MELAADPANDGLVILAREQTAGRGRQGRRWLCPPGCGVLMSVLLLPPERLRQPALQTALAAVAVCETIYHHTRLQATIKWPNDVLVRGKKVCGILVEQGQGTVIGIGLNVNTPANAFVDADLPQAASLAVFANEPLSIDEVARTLIQSLDAGYSELLAGTTGDLEARWRWHSGLLGKQATLRTAVTTCTGRIVDFTFVAVTVQVADGEIRRIDPELIQQIIPVPGPDA
jgi:BirA family transcriptional regulator, biotin operon repressor / biotin---[acetyl-CoA-carboxylase] ligase